MSQRRDSNLGPLASARVVEDLAGGPKVKASNPSQEIKEVEKIKDHSSNPATHSSKEK